MEIHSPPYPLPSANPEKLFEQLLELHDWVSMQFDWAAMEASRLNLQPEPFVPKLIPRPRESYVEQYKRLAVVDMSSSWQGLRSLREQFDSIVRNYEEEEAWDSKTCIYRRLQVLRSASFLLSMAFLPREQREAREMASFQQGRKEWLSVFRDMLNGTLQQEDDDDGEDDKIDYDKLFGSDD